MYVESFIQDIYDLINSGQVQKSGSVILNICKEDYVLEEIFKVGLAGDGENLYIEFNTERDLI